MKIDWIIPVSSRICSDAGFFRQVLKQQKGEGNNSLCAVAPAGLNAAGAMEFRRDRARCGYQTVALTYPLLPPHDSVARIM